MLRGKDIEIGFTDEILRAFETEPVGARLVDHNNTTIPIHEINIVLDVVHQVFHQIRIIQSFSHSGGN